VQLKEREELRNKMEKPDHQHQKEHEHVSNIGHTHEAHAHHEHTHEAHKHPEETKKEQGEKEIKVEKKELSNKTKKDEAIAFGQSLPASKKHFMYICSFIKNKPIDKAMLELEQVIKLKRAIPFKGEIPHRKGMMSGRYPVKASKIFIKLLKGLKGNVLVNNMALDRTRITFASANWASRPLRGGGKKAKRTHVLLKATEVKK